MPIKTMKYTRGAKTRYGKDVDSKSTHVYNARQARTDYAATLIDPTLNLGCRIPDLACYPTAVWTTEYHQPFQFINTNTATNNMVMQVSLMTCPRVQCYQGSNGTTPGALTTTGPASAASPLQVGDTDTNLKARFKAARLVSGIAKLTFAGNDTITEGTIYASYLPPDYGGTYAYAPQLAWDAAQWSANPGYYNGPLKNGACIRYKPSDGTAWDMQITEANGLKPAPFGIMVFMISVPASTTSLTFQLDIVLNWEGLLANNQTGIPPAISGADPGALAHGLNAAAESDGEFAATATAWAKNVDAILRSVT